MNIKDFPKEEKPREKLMLRGAEQLSNQELLAILIGSGTREKSALALAGEMLTMDKAGLDHLRECTVEELCNVKGIGSAKACHLVAAFELGRRVCLMPSDDRISIEDCNDLAAIFMAELKNCPKEYFKTVMLDTQGCMIAVETASIGDLNTAIVNPREIFRPAIKRSAASVAFVHNHPSGDPSPSFDDIGTTRRLVQSGNLLGIRVIDHVIIGGGEFVSLKREGYVGNMG